MSSNIESKGETVWNSQHSCLCNEWNWWDILLYNAGWAALLLIVITKREKSFWNIADTVADRTESTPLPSYHKFPTYCSSPLTVQSCQLSHKQWGHKEYLRSVKKTCTASQYLLAEYGWVLTAVASFELSLHPCGRPLPLFLLSLTMADDFKICLLKQNNWLASNAFYFEFIGK